MSWKQHLRPAVAETSALRLFDYRQVSGLARLDCNEYPFGLEADELAAFHAALNDVALHRYPDVSGAPLRRLLAARWNLDADEILLGNGSVEVLEIAMTAFGAPRPDGAAKVLYPEPSFPYYEVLARTRGLVPLPVPLAHDFSLDEAEVARAIDEHRPALAIFASPNNPTGNRFDPEVLLRLARRMDGVFVIDEAYVDFAAGGPARASSIRRVRDTPGLLVTRTLSKVGFAGLRVGALIGARAIVAELDKVRIPWNLDAVSLAFACALLARPERLEARGRALVALRRSLDERLRRIPNLTVFPSETNFILVRTPAAASGIFDRLLARGVLVKDVSRPGLLDRCLRITIGTPPENERCARAIEEALRV